MNKNKGGFAQIFVVAGLVLMAVALPLASQLVQKNTENRGKATTNCVGEIMCYSQEFGYEPVSCDFNASNSCTAVCPHGMVKRSGACSTSQPTNTPRPAATNTPSAVRHYRCNTSQGSCDEASSGPYTDANACEQACGSHPVATNTPRPNATSTPAPNGCNPPCTFGKTCVYDPTSGYVCRSIVPTPTPVASGCCTSTSGCSSGKVCNVPNGFCPSGLSCGNVVPTPTLAVCGANSDLVCRGRGAGSHCGVGNLGVCIKYPSDSDCYCGTPQVTPTRPVPTSTLRLVPIGGACTGPVQCGTGNGCVNGICVRGVVPTQPPIVGCSGSNTCSTSCWGGLDTGSSCSYLNTFGNVISGKCCDFSAGNCGQASNRKNGCGCSSSVSCASGSCHNGVCVDRVCSPNQVRCVNGKQSMCLYDGSGWGNELACVSGRCDGSHCSAFPTTIPTPQPGACAGLLNKPDGCSCSLGVSCASGVCTRGICGNWEPVPTARPTSTRAPTRTPTPTSLTCNSANLWKTKCDNGTLYYCSSAGWKVGGTCN